MSRARSVPPLSHLTSCTPTKFNINLAISLATIISNLPYRDPSHSTCQISCWFFLADFVPMNLSPSPTPCVTFRNELLFCYSVELLDLRPTEKLEEDPLSAVCNCLFNMFTATLHIWKLCSPTTTGGCAVLWWQGTHLTLSGPETY
jgi:hypothetical protein